MSNIEGRVFLTPTRSKGRKSFTVKQKLEAVIYSESSTISNASRIFKVDRKCIREWKRKRVELEKLIEEGTPTRKRIKGAGARLKYSDLEDNLYEWIMQQREQKYYLTRAGILRKAVEMSQVINDEPIDFLGQQSWLSRFLLRKGLTLRRKPLPILKEEEYPSDEEGMEINNVPIVLSFDSSGDEI